MKLHKEVVLTEAESEVMAVVWEKCPITIREIFSSIIKKRDVAYTTVATTVKILEDKKFLTSEKSNKAHLFKPLVEKNTYRRFAARTLIDKLFGGEASNLVMNLIKDEELTAEEKDSIRKLFEESL
ncbi:MAG: BlaI/MecI/CopY family transcriptional regulator [Bdellovibrionaceae bacterium]|nr:BlaI/MecI/CopY family transcriptional regulator [Pseudobdellovibrionaceae bacterium]